MNFAALTAEQKLVWSRTLWKQARDLTFIEKFTGGSDSVIQRITELTRTEKGEQVIIHLLADLIGDGVVGDNERENNEEEMQSYNDKITIDLISHGVRQKGKMADQKTVINFRENARDKLAYWLANRVDQLAFLTLSGISYGFKNDGSVRDSSAFSTLSFANDVSAPTANRHRRWDGTAGALAPGNTAAMTAADTMSYATLVAVNVFMKTQYVKPLMVGGKEYYMVFVRPEALAQLKMDPNYQRALVTGLERGKDNPFFTGGTVTVDGLIIHEHRLVYNTLGAAPGSKWGAAGTVNGSRVLVCGPQALGMADLGAPEWSEKWFNYDSSPGINVDKMLGFVKPKFYSIYSKSIEDFGVLALDIAI
jgi:N4-gp56 family major capsid protein